jgi:hypothetical protein
MSTALPVLSRRSHAEGWRGFLVADDWRAGTNAIIISANQQFGATDDLEI